MVSTSAMIAPLATQRTLHRTIANGLSSRAEARRAHRRQSAGMSVMGT